MTLFTRLALLLALLAGCSAAMAEGVMPFGDVLVWHASEETSSIWSSTITTSGTPQTFSAENVQFDWNAGFRIGFAHQADSQSWDARLYWTNFRSTDNTEIPPGNHLIVPEFFSGFVSGDAGIFNSAALHWNLTFNNIDFEFGRTIAVGNSISLRPAMGLKAALIDQKILANWALVDPIVGLSATERVDHEFRGLGPCFSIDGRWNLPQYDNLTLVGAFSVALLWGTWNVDDTYERTDDAFPYLTYGAFTTSLKDSSLGTPNLNYFLGLEWTRHGDITVAARLGYELQWWANQQRLPTFQQLPMHGDLVLQGLTCGISVGF